jgi:hypothetical protein
LASEAGDPGEEAAGQLALDAAAAKRKGRARRLTTVERAFELARSGACHSVDEIVAQLHREQLEAVEAHLAGPQIRRDLRQICAEVRRSAGSARGFA